MQIGRIVSASPLAFGYERWPAESEHLKPKVGDIVWYARYGGALIECAFDGNMYRMILDKDINAIIEPPTADVDIRERSDQKPWELEPGS